MCIEAEARVAAGARLLNLRLPGWADRIEVDNFDIDDPNRCVLGQLAAQERMIAAGNGYVVMLQQLSIPASCAAELGFACTSPAKSLMASVQAVVRGNDDNLRETIENLRVATQNLDQLTEQVKQRPWSLVRIRQPKDRKVPQ